MGKRFTLLGLEAKAHFSQDDQKPSQHPAGKWVPGIWGRLKGASSFQLTSGALITSLSGAGCGAWHSWLYPCLQLSQSGRRLRSLSPPSARTARSPIPFVRVGQCQGGSPTQAGAQLHSPRCLWILPGRGRRARDSSSECSGVLRPGTLTVGTQAGRTRLQR